MIINMKKIILFLTLLLFLLTDCTVIQAVKPQNILELSHGWAGNTVNTVIFRHHGVLTFGDYQYTAYYKDKETMKLVRRSLKTDEVETSSIKGTYNVFDAHNSISLGIDKDGHVHISYDHHGHDLRYRVSENPLDISEWSEPLPMTGVRERRVTYPAFVMNHVDSTFIFLYRDGGSSNGQACLKVYDSELKKWGDLPDCIMSGRNKEPWSSNPYWNHPVFDQTGNLHLSYVWRTHSAKKNGELLINNIGIDYSYSTDDGVSWNTTKGYTLNLPITQVISETVWAVPVGSNLINQTSMTVNSDGNPHIVYYANDENDILQYQHLWYDGKKWNNSVISNRKEPFALSGGGTLQIPISRPEIVIDEQDIVYAIFRADFTDGKMSAVALYPPYYEFDKENIKVLWDEPLGFAEPVIDRLRWQRDNVLSMLIQYNYQPDGDRDVQEAFKPVYILDWDLIEMFLK